MGNAQEGAPVGAAPRRARHWNNRDRGAPWRAAIATPRSRRGSHDGGARSGASASLSFPFSFAWPRTWLKLTGQLGLVKHSADASSMPAFGCDGACRSRCRRGRCFTRTRDGCRHRGEAVLSPIGLVMATAGADAHSAHSRLRRTGSQLRVRLSRCGIERTRAQPNIPGWKYRMPECRAAPSTKQNERAGYCPCC
jgi:hypothetical protein